MTTTNGATVAVSTSWIARPRCGRCDCCWLREDESQWDGCFECSRYTECSWGDGCPSLIAPKP